MPVKSIDCEHICITDGCNNPIPLGLFCSLKCAVSYGACSEAGKWIMEDSKLDKIKRERNPDWRDNEK